MSIEQGYSVIASLDPVEEGKLYDHPVHLKLLPWFTVDASPDVLAGRLQNAMDLLDLFTITGLGEIGLSTRGNHRARLVGERTVLSVVHDHLLEGISGLDPAFDKPQYIGENFVPHVTPQVTGSRWIRRNQTVDIAQLHLVGAVADRPMSGTVIKTFPLERE
jgi:hypothetical protein